MKLAYSTLACPEWNIEKILTSGSENGYTGIEFRGLGPEIDLTKSNAFSTPQSCKKTLNLVENAGLKTACISTSMQIVAKAQTTEDFISSVNDGQKNIEIASDMQAPVIRVFCGNIPDNVSQEEAIKNGARLLNILGDYAEENGVKIAVETHDAFMSAVMLSKIINAANHSAVGALWDVHHPYRFCNESPEFTMKNIGRQVIHTHFKDSIGNAENYTYKLLGEGDIPNIQAIKLLHQSGYDGYYTLEWEKRWHPELVDADVTIPQYADKMREYANDLQINS
ncbi:MAG: sugar phosphate isomerase/epimerase [bacterium]